MKLWVDDMRAAPNGWFGVFSTNDAYDVICEAQSKNEQLLISLDHDAGDFSKYGGDYIVLLNILEQLYVMHREWRDYIDDKVTFDVHSMNPVGVENMRRIIRKNNWREV